MIDGVIACRQLTKIPRVEKSGQPDGSEKVDKEIMRTIHYR